jgi:hypothetical protein
MGSLSSKDRTCRQGCVPRAAVVTPVKTAITPVGAGGVEIAAAVVDRLRLFENVT